MRVEGAEACVGSRLVPICPVRQHQHAFVENLGPTLAKPSNRLRKRLRPDIDHSRRSEGAVGPLGEGQYDSAQGKPALNSIVDDCS